MVVTQHHGDLFVGLKANFLKTNFVFFKTNFVFFKTNYVFFKTNFVFFKTNKIHGLAVSSLLIDH